MACCHVIGRLDPPLALSLSLSHLVPFWEGTCVPNVSSDVISDPDGCPDGSQVRGNHMFAIQEQEVAFVHLLIGSPPPPPSPPVLAGYS